MKTYQIILSTVVSVLIAWFAWQVIPTIKPQSMQSISSTIASISGMLFGFVLASSSILASANGNRLVENTRKTGYLKQLVWKLHFSMVLLISVCFIFLMILFIPEDLMLSKAIRASAVILAVGVFVAAFSVCIFVFVWREFSQFSSHL